MFGGIGLDSGGIGGGGTVFIGDGSGRPELDESDDLRAEAGTVGCEKGLPGPFGPSMNVWATAEFGADAFEYDCDGGATSTFFNASDIEGKKLPLGDSFSSLVERRDVDSGGEW